MKRGQNRELPCGHHGDPDGGGVECSAKYRIQRNDVSAPEPQNKHWSCDEAKSTSLGDGNRARGGEKRQAVMSGNEA